MAERNEEVRELRERNSEVEQKINALTSECAVLQSDSEIIKTKARQMLVEKEEEINRLKGLT